MTSIALLILIVHTVVEHLSSHLQTLLSMDTFATSANFARNRKILEHIGEVGLDFLEEDNKIGKNTANNLLPNIDFIHAGELSLMILFVKIPSSLSY